MYKNENNNFSQFLNAECNPVYGNLFDKWNHNLALKKTAGNNCPRSSTRKKLFFEQYISCHVKYPIMLSKVLIVNIVYVICVFIFFQKNQLRIINSFRGAQTRKYSL